MVLIIEGSERQRYPDLFSRLFRLRHDLFIKQAGWSLPSKDDLEIDQYDTDDAIYFIDIDSLGNIHASTRVNLTLTGSLLADYFPHLILGHTAARGEGIYEATRYIVLGDGRSAQSARAAKIRVLIAIFEWCIERDAKFIQAVIENDQLATFVSISTAAKPLGLPHVYGGGKHVPGGGECIALRWPATRKVLDDIRQYAADHELPLGDLEQSAIVSVN